MDAWHRLAEITVPVTVACGDLDVPFIVDRCRLLAASTARYHVPAWPTSPTWSRPARSRNSYRSAVTKD